MKINKKLIDLTFFGLKGTRSLSLLIPGMMTVILLGPFIPRTFVSWFQKHVKSEIGTILFIKCSQKQNLYNAL